MSRINFIEKAILELEGGEFQKLFDAYLYKKCKFKNIQTLGVQEGTNKTTKGIPDSYVIDDEGKYILIMYGSVEKGAYKKIKEDIESCFDQKKSNIDKHKIKKIICAYSSTNLTIEQQEKLKDIVPNIEVELVGLSTISHDLLVNYPNIAKDYLNIPIDTHQIFTGDEFVEAYDKTTLNAPLDTVFCYREQEKKILFSMINSSKVTLVSGNSGVGKTRLVLEVCKQFDTEGWNVLCVKNNGGLLYDDIRYYISDMGKYIIFIDDANQTQSLDMILGYIISLSDQYDIKLVMTIRDYARDIVKRIVNKYIIPEEITINTVSDDEIMDILKANFGIFDKTFLDRIVKIAKGNPRIAILAGKVLKDRKYLDVTDTSDIFSVYYAKMLEEALLDDASISVLFVISFLQTIRFKMGTNPQKIMSLVGVTTEQFKKICHELCAKEIVDIYQNEVVRVSDQSLADYIIEYFLIEKKKIFLYQLLEVGFPVFKDKIVYVINTLLQLFYSDITKKYIADQVNMAWEGADKNHQDAYLQCFYVFNEEKTLAILKKRIENTPSVNMNVLSFNIERKKNYKHIKDSAILVLSQFKHSQYYQDAVELLITYYKKRPDYIMDFYFCFSDKMLYDLSSANQNYDKEYGLVHSLWSHSNQGKDTNIIVLLLHVLMRAFKCDVQAVIPADRKNEVNLISYQIKHNAGNEKLRFLMWEILALLYKDDKYVKLVTRIIIGSNITGKSENEKKIYSYDLRCIKKLFFNNKIQLTFEQCRILDALQKHAKWMGVYQNKFLNRYIENDDYMIYRTLITRKIGEASIEKRKLDRKTRIESMVSNYTVADFSRLFQICKMCEANGDKESWYLRSGIDIIFETIENNPNLFRSVVNAYVQSGAPYCDMPNRIIGIFIKHFGVDETKKFIDAHRFQNKNIWRCAFWESVPSKMITRELTEELIGFFKEEALSENPCFPKVLSIEKYIVEDNKVIKSITGVIASSHTISGEHVAHFLGYPHDDDTIQAIVNLFKNDMKELESLYLCAQGDFFDPNMKLLIEIVKRKPEFWKKFILYICNSNKETISESYSFEPIWMMDNYKEMIHIAYENMLDGFGRNTEDMINVIFTSKTCDSAFIQERQKQWISTYIKTNFQYKKELKTIFEIIEIAFPEEKKNFIIEFADCSKDFDVFKSIPLFASMDSWSDSEVPLIEKKIAFLDELIASLRGACFIDHRAYLKDIRTSLEKYKQEVLIREYIANIDGI